MHLAPAVITVNIAPTIHVGPLTIAWHGLTIALGIVVGAALGAWWARRRGLDPEPLYTISMILGVGALIGGRAFYLAEHGDLGDPAKWFGTTGFTFDGGFIAAAVGIGVYVRRAALGAVYLDVVAAALPLGIAVGRIGDIINGEHYGPATTFVLGVRNANPDSLTPRHDVAYHNGGLYEVLLALVVFAVIWPMRHRLMGRPTATVWAVLALFSAGRFLEFFVREDSPSVAVGLSSTQWTSLVLLVVAGGGAWWTLVHRPVSRPRQPTGPDDGTRRRVRHGT